LRILVGGRTCEIQSSVSPIAEKFSITGDYVGKGGDSQVQPASLGMNKVRWFEPRETRELFHYKKVALSLGEEPLVGIKSDLGVD
jgi:hypothetical protein